MQTVRRFWALTHSFLGLIKGSGFRVIKLTNLTALSQRAHLIKQRDNLKWADLGCIFPQRLSDTLGPRSPKGARKGQRTDPAGDPPSEDGTLKGVIGDI